MVDVLKINYKFICASAMFVQVIVMVDSTMIARTLEHVDLKTFVDIYAKLDDPCLINKEV